MVGFYCVTAFQVFLSVLIRDRCFKHKNSTIFIVVPLVKSDYDIQALYDAGFNSVIIIDTEEKANSVFLEFEQLFFFSIFCAYPNSLKRMKTNKLILGYEGITTYQLKNWSDSDYRYRFDIERDIDEIWLPDLELLLDKEYLYKAKEFSIKIGDDADDRKIICQLNKIFKYTYDNLIGNTVFMDRYLSKYVGVINGIAEEKLLTEIIFYGNGGNAIIKRHPADSNYREKYKHLKNARVIENNVPWELIYLNGRMNGMHISKYIIYNSFAPINMSLLFKDNDFECICVEPLLGRYSRIENSYLDTNITNKILTLFSNKYKVEINYISSINELEAFRGKAPLKIDDNDWERCENILTEEYENINILELRAFRLQLDCVLLNKYNENGFYWFTKINRSAVLTQKILQAVLPQFKKTDKETEADFIIDTNGSRIDLSRDCFDVVNMQVIEGCCRGNQFEYEQDLIELLKTKDQIYIWGASKSNYNTYMFLNRVKKITKVKYIFDNFVTGERYGIKIVPFSKEIVGENAFIFVCANIAYPEIRKILVNNGFVEGKDFTLGVGNSICQ